ncbi:hypothetical protein [Actinoplanes siamensis]|uniref:Secreted protein n=1 Tax=Actinoplanes siamensis TaxID=1223317 RepID=A0A919N502_9ACTN|nr:hypothetical protein [Actinoplanes siamensis]GIF04485.1 hypothetical protein Asi03nite_20230 [Actinoplanes siamensis]
MSTRRVSSRKVVLTATFLALAAGSTAACNKAGEEREYAEEPAYAYDSGSSGGGTVVEDPVTEDPVTDEEPAEEEFLDEEAAEEVFYCADEEGEIADEDYCDDDTGRYFIWHSTSYSRGLGPGAHLDGGDYFPPGDTTSRRAFKLPTAGRVSNGTVKTNIVGRASSGSTAGGISSSGG